jgi:hypothetical protein
LYGRAKEESNIDPSMDNLRKEIEASFLLNDNKPLVEFDGLSRSEMRYLIHSPFSKDSPLQLNRVMSDRTLDQVPILKPVEYLINRLIQAKKIRLTKKGFLPTAIVKEIYDVFSLKDRIIEMNLVRLYSELSSETVHLTRELSEICEFIENENNKLLINPVWKNHYINKNRSKIFRRLFIGFTIYYDWSKIGFCTNPNSGQNGFTFTLFLLSKYGKNYKPLSFYINKYVKAFPFSYEELRPVTMGMCMADSFTSSFQMRTIEGFLINFNLIDYQFVEKRQSDRQLIIKKSRIFDKLIKFE